MKKIFFESLADEILINFIKNDIFDNFKNINLYNANNKVYEIISNVQTIFKESINLQLNGYFETQKKKNNNKQSYGEISERAMNISHTLDNNELIDKIFDKIMIYFRVQFIEL